jgi:hypothetical protein
MAPRLVALLAWLLAGCNGVDAPGMSDLPCAGLSPTVALSPGGPAGRPLACGEAQTCLVTLDTHDSWCAGPCEWDVECDGGCCLTGGNGPYCYPLRYCADAIAGDTEVIPPMTIDARALPPTKPQVPATPSGVPVVR